ncbi:hypothetical protein HJD18_08485 [Thermoleophilia bacterium SCSIO 60948]|nr:hypothetical protein HJD18_08485 [Thermoleophilia bacterium SCSIO 60948]
MADSFFASSSVRVHLIRGVVGLVALVGGLVALGPLGAIGLLGFPIAFIAWRGCPTCWALGLAATRERVACESCQTGLPGGEAVR